MGGTERGEQQKLQAAFQGVADFQKVPGSHVSYSLNSLKGTIYGGIYRGGL